MFLYIGHTTLHLSTFAFAAASAVTAALLTPKVPWLVLALCGAI